MSTTPEARLNRRAFLGLVGAVASALTMVSPPSSAALTSEPPLQIWFIRHGESEINVAGSAERASGTFDQKNHARPVPDGGVSHPLTRRGVEQARALAESLSGAPITKIYSSTHLRAIQTADALAFEHLLPLQLAPEAVEIDLGIRHETGVEVRAVYEHLARKWLFEKDLDARHGDGESFAEVQRRFLPFVREIMNRHALDSGIVVIVGHSATLGFMVPVLASNVPADFALRHPLPNTGIIKTELRDGRLFCTQWAGIASNAFGE